MNMRNAGFGGLVLTFVLLALPFHAAAQARACLNDEEAGGLVTFALPTLIRGLSQRCSRALPATASLIQAGSITAARYQVDADKAWPIARVAFDKISGLPLSDVAGEEGVKTLVQQGFASAISQEIKAEDCVTADALINILQPLPARNMAMLITTLIGAGSKTFGARLPVKLCGSVDVASSLVRAAPK
jgi:hypothetical protein